MSTKLMLTRAYRDVVLISRAEILERKVESSGPLPVAAMLSPLPLNSNSPFRMLLHGPFFSSLLCPSPLPPHLHGTHAQPSCWLPTRRDLPPRRSSYIAI